jgi:hypothetical protein
MKTTILANGQPHELEAGRFTVIAHQQGIKIEVPESLTIGAMDTIKMADSLNEQQWQHISSGPLFQHFFNIIFKDAGSSVTVPKTVDDLKRGDYGVKHISGMIIILVENSPLMSKNPPKKVYLEYPETFLHPAQTRSFMSMLYDLMKLYGDDISGGVTVK